MADERNLTPTADDFPADDPKKRVAELQACLNEAEAVVRKIKKELNTVSLKVAKTELKSIPLHVLNQQAREATRTETKRRFRVHEALERMVGHYDAVRKPHPPLFEGSKKE